MNAATSAFHHSPWRTRAARAVVAFAVTFPVWAATGCGSAPGASPLETTPVARGLFAQPVSLAGAGDRDALVIGALDQPGAVDVATTAGGARVTLAGAAGPASADVPGHAGAPVPAVEGTAPAAAGDGDQAFQVLTSLEPDRSRSERVVARPIARGTRCTVYLDTAVIDASALPPKLAEIQRAFDDRIYAADTALYGPPPRFQGEDVATTRVDILVSPAVNDHGRTGTAGYFAWRDLSTPAPGQSALLRASNHRRLLCLSSSLLLTGTSADYLGVVAHEFAHMLVFARKSWDARRNAPTAFREDRWLDEALATYAMGAAGFGPEQGAGFLSDHVARFEADPGAYSLTAWQDNPQGEGYGMAYLFMRYLARTHGEDAVRELASAGGAGTAQLDRMLRGRGSSLGAAFRGWALASVREGRVRTAPWSARRYALRPYNARFLALPVSPGARRLDARGFAHVGDWRALAP